MAVAEFETREVKQKVKNSWSTYSQELTETEKSGTHKPGTGSKDIYVPTVKWFHEVNTFIKHYTSEEKNSEQFKYFIVWY
jgi:hypothetical protein